MPTQAANSLYTDSRTNPCSYPQRITGCLSSECARKFPVTSNINLNLGNEFSSLSFFRTQCSAYSDSLIKDLNKSYCDKTLEIERTCRNSTPLPTKSLVPACSILSNALQPHGLQPTSPLCSLQEHWSGLLFLPPADLPNSGIKLVSSALAGRFFTMERVWEGSGIIYSAHSTTIY